jgi:AraC-like DNA-binding protein
VSAYREFLPSPELRDHVECYWTREDDDANASHRVLPDGCVDILIERTAARQTASVVGTMTRAIVVPAVHPRRFTAIRFRPGGAFGFLHVPMRELSDENVDLTTIWNDTSELVETVEAARSSEERARALDRELLNRIGTAQPMDSLVAAALARIRQSCGQLRVDALSAELGVSRQHLTRKFDEQIGISTKMFSRVWRLQSAVERIRHVQDIDWSDLALDSGYYDQAHMIGEFRELVGETPARFSETF